MSNYKKIFSILLTSLCINSLYANDNAVQNNYSNFTIYSSNVQNIQADGDNMNSGSTLQFIHGDTILDNNITMTVGDKNDDNFYTQNQYAKLSINNNSNLLLRNGCTLKVQKDGLLCNRGTIIVNNGSNLILAPSTSVGNNGPIKSGLDNQDGTIVVNSGSSIYWYNNNERTYTTIQNGTVDFSNCLYANNDNVNNANINNNNLKIKLKNVKVKLNDYNINCANTNVLKDVCIEDNCELICNTVTPNINKIKDLFNNNSENFTNIK